MISVTSVALAHYLSDYLLVRLPSASFGKGFALICLPKGIQVRLPKRALQDWGPVHLNDPRCGAEEESDTHVVLKTPLDSCGTVRRSINGRTVYTNSIIGYAKNDDADKDKPALNFPFMCNMSRGMSATEMPPFIFFSLPLSNHHHAIIIIIMIIIIQITITIIVITSSLHQHHHHPHHCHQH